MLIRFFTQRYAKKLNRAIEEIPSTAFEALIRYDWPGNIRELQNVIERSVILSDGPEFHVAMAQFSGDPAADAPHSQEPSWVAGERARILQALKEAKGLVGAERRSGSA